MLLYVSMILGIVLVMILVVSLVLGEVWSRVWKWMNDGDKLSENKVWDFVCVNIFKYEKNTDDTLFTYKATDKCMFKGVSDGEHCLAIMAAFLFLSPTIFVLVFKFYPLFIAIGILTGLAHLARFGIRTSKKLTGHVENKNIHNKEVG